MPAMKRTPPSFGRSLETREVDFSSIHWETFFMKTLIRFAVAGALMAGFATAQAQNLPDTGNADLWVFVSDPSAHTTYAEDTGLSLSSLLPTSSLVSGASLATSIQANFSVAATAGL